MYAIGLILVAFLVGTCGAIPLGYSLATDFQSDYYNGFQPCYGSNLCRSLFPSDPLGNTYPANYLSSVAVVDSDILSSWSADNVYNYPYNSARTVSFDKENYIRDYGYGSTEVGVRDRVLMRPRVPAVVPSYSRICSYFPFGICQRGVNRYPLLSIDYDF